ncbi:NAD(P)/FAD-dependent oxidoreductase [Tepidibacillus sp. LV47]|uniref:NAD(P)/FAD-dependent oxidoreductase n=1 Tax=Tepidibacillus sp. LV47 TaxID=3398228 RepID=UPI003AAA9C74
MAIRISNIKLPLEHTERDLVEAIEKKLRVPLKKIKKYEIVKRSIDARRDVRFVYQIEATLTIDEKKLVEKLRTQDVQIVKEKKKKELIPGDKELLYPPIIIGAGPSGLFAALELAKHGYRPLILERGKDVERRSKDILHFWRTGELNIHSNVQFGEGGAGTFSDGKLTTRIKDSRIDQVFQTFVEAGAPKEILYVHKPHIGTDNLKKIVYNLRQRLIKMGAIIKFDSLVTNLIIEHGKVVALEVNHKYQIPAQVVIMAIGHSARDTYEMLYQQGVKIQGKPLAIGARIEHPQQLINEAQYGRYANAPQLGAADYTLVKKAGESDDDRACYSFCMCPGGVVVAAASEKGMVVTNGMSYYSRASRVANSALVATVSTDDFKGDDPLAGVRYLRKYEKKAYQLGGGGYKAPAQKVGDFLDGVPSNDFADVPFRPTYRPGITPSDLHFALPDFVSKSLEQAILEFGKKLRGYDSRNAVLTGVETRTSAPVRIPRKDDFQSENVEGLYPAGEGAGYAGGIVSAAVDGIRVAEHLIETYRRPRKVFEEEDLEWENISEPTE